MLCDDIVAALVSYRGGLHQGARTISAMVQRAQRFVLSPLMVRAVNDLADRAAMTRCAEHLFLPAERTWIEWTDDDRTFGGGRQAVMLAGTTLVGEQQALPYNLDAPVDIRSGTIVTFRRPIEPPAFGAAQPPDYFDLSRGNIGASPAAAWAWAAIALINTPRMTQQVGQNLSRLNRARPRAPHLSYVDVTITPDAGLPQLSRDVGSTGGRARHHVRAHMRIRRGRVEVVRPHWRGDVKNGVRLARHVVRRIEDESGAWTGGPLPPPRILG